MSERAKPTNHSPTPPKKKQSSGVRANAFSLRMYSKQVAQENRLLKKWVIGVGVFHLVVLLMPPIDFAFMPLQQPQEMVIETELITLPNENPDSLAKSVKAEELKVKSTILPQLPKDFKLTSEQIVEDSKDEVLSHVQEHDKPAPESEFTEVDREKKEDSQKIKRVALDRLLKEKARLEKKFSKKEQTSPLDRTLKQRKKDLAQLHDQIKLGQEGNEDDAYRRILQRWVAKNYALPKVYQLNVSEKKAVVEMTIDGSGEIRHLKLTQSSQDAVFDKLAMNTIKKSAPFPRPPRDWVGRAIVFPFENNTHIE